MPILSITLNAFPLEFPNHEIEACVIPYDEYQYNVLKAGKSGTCTIRRRVDDILVFSSNGEYPVVGEIETLDLTGDFGLFCFLAKDGVKRHLSSINRQVSGFFPIELLSSKTEDDLLFPDYWDRLSIPDRRKVQP